MARPKKEAESLSCKIDKQVSDKIQEIVTETGLSKTTVVERAVLAYYEKYKNTGRI